MRLLSFPRIFYGWWMVVSAFGIQFLTSGLLVQSYGAYVTVLEKDFGWSKAALSGAYSMQQLQAGLLGPGQGWLIDRFGPRLMIQAGIVMLGAGFILLGFIDSLATFYAVFFLMSLGSVLAGFFPLTVAIVNWFERKRARAISLMSVGFALGGVVVPVVAYFLESFGWRTTAAASGVLIIAVGLPLSQLIRRRPEEYGEVVDGGPAADARGPDEPRDKGRPYRDFTFAEAVRTPAFWLISFGHSSALLIVSAVNVHIVSHMEEGLGYSLGAAAAMVTLMTTMQLIGMLIGGYLGDRTDNSLLATVCMGMHASGLLLAAYAVALPMVIAFAVLHGLAWGIRGPLMQAIRADYFGRSAFGLIMGVSSLITMVGLIAGPMIAGVLADTTGSYQSGFTVLALLAGLGSIFFILAKRPELPVDATIEADPAVTATR